LRNRTNGDTDTSHQPDPAEPKPAIPPTGSERIPKANPRGKKATGNSDTPCES
jgi:hypothetical protein